MKVCFIFPNVMQAVSGGVCIQVHQTARALREKVWPLIEAGRVKPLIDTVFPLKDAAKAHALMEKSSHIGKIILTI